MREGERLTFSETYAALIKLGNSDWADRERNALRLATYIENMDQRLASLEERLAKAEG